MMAIRPPTLIKGARVYRNVKKIICSYLRCLNNLSSRPTLAERIARAATPISGTPICYRQMKITLMITMMKSNLFQGSKKYRQLKAIILMIISIVKIT